MQISLPFKFMNCWAHSRVAKLFLFQSKNKVLDIVRLNDKFIFQSVNRIYLSRLADDIIPHQEKSIFMICYSAEGIIQLFDYYSNKLTSVQFSNTFAKALFTSKYPNFLVIGYTKLTVYDFHGKVVNDLTAPAYPQNGKSDLLAFSPSGEFLAICPTKTTLPKDYVIIVNTRWWEQVDAIQLDGVQSVSQIMWINNIELAVSNNRFSYFVRKVEMYPTNSDVYSFSPGPQYFGIREMGLMKDDLLMIEDKGFRILDKKNFKSRACTEFLAIHKKCPKNMRLRKQISFEDQSGFELIDKQMKQSFFKSLVEQKPKKQQKDITMIYKISKVDTRYIAFTTFCNRKILYIWDNAKSMMSDAIIMKYSINSFQWSPNDDILCIHTDTSQLSFWTNNGTSCYNLNMETQCNISDTVSQSCFSPKLSGTVSFTWHQDNTLRFINKGKKDLTESRFQIIQLEEEFLNMIKTNLVKEEQEQEIEFSKNQKYQDQVRILQDSTQQTLFDSI